MAGRRRRRRRHLRPPEDSSPPAPTALREVADADRPPKKSCHASSSTSSATTTSGPDVWPDLLDSLLHQIITLLSSFHDLLAFIGTCRSWRIALSSLPPVSSFSFPPLHLHPHTGHSRPRHYFAKNSNSLFSNCKWQLTDPAKRNSSLCRSAPQNLLGRMRYLGCSHGYLIFSRLECCLLVDVYSGANVRPPKLKSTGNHGIYYGVLVPALNTLNSHLLLCSKSSLLQWQVGTNSWLEHPLGGEGILQIVFFNREIFAIDFLGRLHRIRLAPQLSMQEVAVVWGEDMIGGLNFKPWLVVCGDTLLLVDLSISIADMDGLSCTSQVFRLDLSVEPAKWVMVENLGNHALFVSVARGDPTFSCMNPERWGGKSNCVYFASQSEDHDEPWTVVELGQAVPIATLCSEVDQRPIEACSQLRNLWVLPSLTYGMAGDHL